MSISRQFPDDGPVEQEERFLVAQSLYLEGCNLMDSGEFTAAINVLSQSMHAEVHHKTLQAMGECHMKLGQYEQAIVELAAAAKLGDQPKAHGLLAQSCFSYGRLDWARRFAEVACERLPHYKSIRELITRIDEATANQRLTEL